MRLRFQRPHDAFSSTRSTGAFGFKSSRAVRPFSLTWNDGRYCRNHLFQNRSARNCTYLHLLWWNWSVLPNEPGGLQAVVFLCISKWEGYVIAWRSCGSSELAVRAHPLNTCSTSVSNVCKNASVTIWVPMIDFRTIAWGSRWLKTPFVPYLKLFVLSLMLFPLF